MIKKAEAIERMKNGETLRHSIGFYSETWLLGNERVHGNTGNALVKTAGVEYLKLDGRFSTYAWKQDIASEEALEADTLQAANDLAGESDYAEVVAEAETAQLRQQLADAQAENEALKKEITQTEAKNAYYRRALLSLAEDSTNWSLDRMRRFAKLSMNPVQQEIDQDIADLQLAFEIHKAIATPPAPKTPVPTRCRVNWNARGFSSGSYPVLGYSPKKQSYVLNISTDNTKVMPKTVKMADCESVS